MRGDNTKDDLISRRLAENPLLGALPDESIKRVRRAVTTRSYRRGEVILRDLEHSAHFTVIVSGSVEIRRDTDAGERTAYRVLHPPAAIGYSFLAGQPATADVVAAEDIEVAEIPLELLKREVASRPEAAAKAIAELAGLVDALSTELLEQRTLPVAERVRSAVYRNAGPDGVLRLSHEDLAHHVGCTRANVTRALNDMKDAGEIEINRRTVRLLYR